MTEESKEGQPAKESENNQSSTEVTTMSAAGKQRIEAKQAAAKQRINADLHQDMAEDNDSSEE